MFGDFGDIEHKRVVLQKTSGLEVKAEFVEDVGWDTYSFLHHKQVLKIIAGYQNALYFAEGFSQGVALTTAIFSE